jgi:hypothetical protein
VQRCNGTQRFSRFFYQIAARIDKHCIGGVLQQVAEFAVATALRECCMDGFAGGARQKRREPEARMESITIHDFRDFRDFLGFWGWGQAFPYVSFANFRGRYSR